MIRDDIATLVQAAAVEAQEKKLLPPVALPEAPIEHPQNPEHGDYASSLPLKLARAARMNPFEVARILDGLLPDAPPIERHWAAPPGFINFVLKEDWLCHQVDEVLRQGERYGSVDLGHGSRVQVEFVSANPTGPLHVGNGRGAVLGSTLANVLAAAGYEVQKEYFINNGGAQVDAFYRTLWARYRQSLGEDVPVPEDGYEGHYMVELAEELGAEIGEGLPEDEAAARETLGRAGLERILVGIRRDLDSLGVAYDEWFSEQSLYDSGQYEQTLQTLAQNNYITEREGATWFTATALGEDKDSVLVKSNGWPTYLAGDAAYHYNKLAVRGFEQVIDIWGADHQGHVGPLLTVIAALGADSQRVHIDLTQMVTLRRGPEVVRLSKRTGDIVTLREVIEEVGADACRFVFLSRAASSQMDFDLELAKKEAPENPVYYVQYAHARIASILRLAEERRIDYSDGDTALLTSEPELGLIRQLMLLPEIVEMAARNREPHHLPHYAQDLATAFHNFYENCRVVSQEPAELPLTKARLKLAKASQTTLARALSLMGVKAPEQM